MAKKTKIKINPKNKGKFTKSAKAAGKSVQEHAHDVMKNPNATPLQKKRANFAIQAKKWHHKKFGGLQYMDGETGANLVLDVPEFFPGDEGYYEPGGEGYMGGADNLYNSPRFSSPMFQPLKKQKIGVPEIKQAPNFKQTIKTPQIHSYDFYDPQTGNINQPQNNNTKFSEVAPYIPTNSIFNNYYLNKGNQFRKKAIDSFSKLEDGGFGGGDYWNLASGIANAVTADINTKKGFTDIAGTFKTNAAIEQIKAQNKRQNLVSQYENPTPTFQNSWGGNNPLDNGYIRVGEYGTIVKNFENSPKNMHNVEYQGGEGVMIPTENGYISDYVDSSIKHGDYNPNSASLEGISANLPQGSYVIPGKEISIKEAFLPNKKGELELKQFKTKKAAAKVLKPYYDTSLKENPSNDIFAENSKKLHNELSQPILIENAKKIEQDKLKGVFGVKAQKSAIEDYTMKYGGMKKMSGNDGANTVFTGVNPNVDFKTLRLKESEKQRRNKFLPYEPNEMPTGYGSQLSLESVFNDFENQYGVKLPIGTNEQKLQALREYQTKLTPQLTKDYKLNFARGNKELYQEFTKSKGYKANKDKEKESQNFYDWAKNSGKLTEDYANKGLWGHEYYNIAPLDFSTEAEFNKFTQDPDWAKVGNYYVDRSANPTDPITYYSINKKYGKPSTVSKASGASSTIDKITPVEGQKSKKGYSPIVAGLQFPDAYLRDPITVNNLNPEFYQPTTISPYLNDIQRLQYATNANLGTSGAELATRANLFGQGLTEYGKRYYDASTYNAQAKTQAARDNANVKQQVNQFNLSNYIQNARNPQLQREAVITEQKRLDRDAQLKTFAEKEHEQAVRNYLEDIYNPQYALNENFNNPYNLKSAEAESEEAKKAKAYETLYGKKKYGGKVKIKAKKKK